MLIIENIAWPGLLITALTVVVFAGVWGCIHLYKEIKEAIRLMRAGL